MYENRKKLRVFSETPDGRPAAARRDEDGDAAVLLDGLGVDTSAIRALAMDAVQKANSGHPGLPMGCAPTS